MIKKTDAAMLTDTGRFYLQVGYNELFLIQSAVVGSIDVSVLRALETDFVMISPKNYKILVAKKESLD